MKRILLIDDSPQNSTLDVIRLNYNNSDELETYWFNPVDRAFYRDDVLDLDIALGELINKYFDKKIDIVGCDIGLGNTQETTAFRIANKIREIDKCCTLFLYSGGLTRRFLKSLDDQGNEGERLLRDIVSSDISRIINARSGVLSDTVLELLEKPKVQLQVLDFLEKHSDLKIETKYVNFHNLSIKQIAREVQAQSVNGISFTKTIIEHGLSLLIDLN